MPDCPGVRPAMASHLPASQLAPAVPVKEEDEAPDWTPAWASYLPGDGERTFYRDLSEREGPAAVFASHLAAEVAELFGAAAISEPGV